MGNRRRHRRLIALTAATGVIAGGLFIGGTGMASPGISRVLDLVDERAEPSPSAGVVDVELRVRPKVDIGAVPRIVAVNPGAAVANDARRPDGPDSPPRRRTRSIPESPAPTQGAEGTQSDPPARRNLPTPQIASPPRPAPPRTPDILPPPASAPALDTAPEVSAPPDAPGESLRPDPIPEHLAPDAPPPA